MAEVTLSEARKSVLLDAVYELTKLSLVLPNLVPIDEDQTHYAVKGVCARIASLSNVLLTGLDDAVVTDKELGKVVNFCDEV